MVSNATADWSTIRLEIARESIRQDLFNRDDRFKHLKKAHEGLAKTKTAKRRHQAMLEALKAPEVLPEPEILPDASLYNHHTG